MVDDEIEFDIPAASVAVGLCSRLLLSAWPRSTFRAGIGVAWTLGIRTKLPTWSLWRASMVGTCSLFPICTRARARSRSGRTIRGQRGVYSGTSPMRSLLWKNSSWWPDNALAFSCRRQPQKRGVTVGAPKSSPTMAASCGFILTSWISAMTLSRATHQPLILRVAATFSRVLLPSCRRRGRTHCSFGLAIGTGTWVVFLRHLPQFRDALVFLLRRPPPVVSSCSGLMRALRLFRWPTATLALGIGVLGGSCVISPAALQIGIGMSWTSSCVAQWSVLGVIVGERLLASVITLPSRVVSLWVVVSRRGWSFGACARRPAKTAESLCVRMRCGDPTAEAMAMREQYCEGTERLAAESGPKLSWDDVACICTSELERLVGRGSRRQGLPFLDGHAKDVEKNRTQLRQQYDAYRRTQGTAAEPRLRAEYKEAKAKARGQRRRWRKTWLLSVVEKLEHAMEVGDMGRFYSGLKELGVRRAGRWYIRCRSLGSIFARLGMRSPWLRLRSFLAFLPIERVQITWPTLRVMARFGGCGRRCGRARGAPTRSPSTCFGIRALLFRSAFSTWCVVFGSRLAIGSLRYVRRRCWLFSRRGTVRSWTIAEASVFSRRRRGWWHALSLVVFGSIQRQWVLFGAINGVFDLAVLHVTLFSLLDF